MNNTQAKNVGYQTEDRQWDIRLNCPDDDYLQCIVENVMLESTNGKFRWVLIGGIEIGTRPNNTDYKCRHVHIGVIFHNRASKSSIIKNWGIIEGHGYYMVPRNRDLPYSGWRDHHIKDFSKIDKSKLILYETGNLPNEVKKAQVKYGPEEKKRKVDDILTDMRAMLEKDEDEEAFKKYPRNYLIYGARLKSMVKQKANFFKKITDPHIWLYGFQGSGKTAILRYLYPKMYKKDLTNRFFDLYDQQEHTHIMLEDLDPECVERLGLQFIKTICDEGGFPIDQKYKTPQLARSVVLVTSNFEIPTVIPDDCKDPVTTRMALYRRFYYVRIDNFLRLLGLKLIDKWDRQKLKKEGNEEPGKLFMQWNYTIDMPVGLPIESPEHYQKVVRDSYFSQ